MKIVCHGARLHAEQLLQILQRLFEECQRLEILQVANVLAHDCVVPFGQAKRVLQFSSAG